ncbi:MAG: hypothetical protein ABNH02_08275 [Pseudomonadales bacterium]|jgi:hypothetical protein
MLVVIALVLLLLVWMLANYVVLAGWWYGCLIILVVLLWRRHLALVTLFSCYFLVNYYVDYLSRLQSIDATVAEVNQGDFSQQLSFHDSDLRLRIDKFPQVEPNCQFKAEVRWRYRPAPEDYGNRLQRQQQLIPKAYSESFDTYCP